MLRSAWQLLRRQTRRLELPAGAGPAWTDDRAPVEFVTERAFRRIRPADVVPRAARG